jgi:uncharacterized protein
MSETHVIKARRVTFDWETTPLHWVPGDPQTTHTVNVLHLLLPAGERWFCQVFRQALDGVGEEHEQLRRDVKGFIGQEAVHARAHQAVLEHLDAQGLDARPYTKRIETLFERVLDDHPFGTRAWLRPLARHWLVFRLAIIAAIEHFTCVLGTWIIEESGELDRLGADPVMFDLLRWHGAEEVEHRCVAFDMFEHVAPRSACYAHRMVAMAAVFPMLVFLWVAGTRFLMRHDPERTGGTRPTMRAFYRAGKAGRLPSARALFGAPRRYLRPSFHPASEGRTDVALAYLATSPAATGYGAAG